ncbi:hypothetical protein OXX79_012252, partial [Metschnikowia pulcherrima]
KNVSEFQRSFVEELRKLDEIERQYAYFKAELDKKGIETKVYPYDETTVCAQSEIDEYAQNAKLLEARTSDLASSAETLYDKQKDLKQMKSTEDPASQLESGGAQEFQANFICGVIDRSKVAPLQQILWRILRGNLYYYTEEVAEPFMMRTVTL